MVMVSSLKIMVEKNLHHLLKALVTDAMYNALRLDVVYLMKLNVLKHT